MATIYTQATTTSIKRDPLNPAALDYVSPTFCDVARLWHRLITTQNPKKIDSALERLGISSDDTCAQEKMKTIVDQLKTGQYTIEARSHTGIYYIRQPLEKHPVAVFKMGEKGPARELAVRALAQSLGLGKYAVPGMFCALSDLSFPDDLEKTGFDVHKELWNGHLAVYDTETSTNQTAIGILKPFIPKAKTQRPKETTEKEEASFLLLALAAGLKDIKPEDRISGVNGPVAVDTEDSFLEETANALDLDLPYLAELHKWEAPLTNATINHLRTIVTPWEIGKIIKSVGKRPILYFDRQAEENPPHPERNEHKVLVTNEGGSKLTLLPGKNPDYRKKKVNPEQTCIAPKELKTLETRLEKLKQYILTTDTFSLKNLAFFLYPRALDFHDTLEQAQREGSASREYLLQSPISSIGRATPENALPREMFLNVSFRLSPVAQDQTKRSQIPTFTRSPPPSQKK